MKTKLVEGTVVIICQEIKNKLGVTVEPIGTIIAFWGTSVLVHLQNDDIWYGDTKLVYKNESRYKAIIGTM